MAALLTASACAGPAEAATTLLTGTVRVTVTNTAPTCDLKVGQSGQDTEVFLGYLTKGGLYRADPLEMRLECLNGNRNAAISASTTLKRDNDSTLVMSNGATRMWLEDMQGNLIDLTGAGSTDPMKRFCAGDSTRDCSVKPVVNVGGNDPTGRTEAMVTFSVKYS
ncbi:TPA: hypothetical protein H1V70_004459 [Salmonella enterica]|nr:hypothetical protein [Salmonella enterica]